MTSPGERDGLAALLAAQAAADAPPTIVLMRLLMEAVTEAEGRAALDAALGSAGGARARARLLAVEALWAGHPSAWRIVRSTIAAASHRPHDGTAEGSLRHWARTFDALVAASPEASVALYSLGSPELLDAAAAEVVARLGDWHMLAPTCDVLDLGCGIGRLIGPLAPLVRSVVGLDLSAGMIAEARRRHGWRPNVRLVHASGSDLADLADGSLDLVLATDVFPYLVLGGDALVRRHMHAFARLLRPGGHVAIFNYSYRGSLDGDRRDVAGEAMAVGLGVERNGTADLATWDGRTFLLSKPGAADRIGS